MFSKTHFLILGCCRTLYVATQYASMTSKCLPPPNYVIDNLHVQMAVFVPIYRPLHVQLECLDTLVEVLLEVRESAQESLVRRLAGGSRSSIWNTSSKHIIDFILINYIQVLLCAVVFGLIHNGTL